MLLFGIYVLSEDPPVFGVPDIFVEQLLPLLPPRVRPSLLVFPTWTQEKLSTLARTTWRLRRAPRGRITWMATTPREVKLLCRAGYGAIWCHQNFFCDETKFTIVPAEKQFDAIYTAIIHPFKRNELAREIRSLRLVTGRFDRLGDLPGLGLGHAVVNKEYLGKGELNEALNGARVGLALSAAEGGMLACTEYLLCGLPVVSTPSLGGRDVWLDPGNSRIVPADPAEVASAVRHFVEEPPDPQAIRADALRRIRFFRTALAEIVHHFSGRLPFDAESIDGSWFTQNYVAIHFLKEYLDSYEQGRFARSDLLGKFA